MKILFVSDVVGWAYDVTYHGIKKYMDCDIMYTSDDPRISSAAVAKYDKVHFFNWLGGQPQAGMSGVSAGITQHNHRLRWPDIAPKYIGRFERVVAISRELEEDVKKLNPNTTYIPNGVDPELFQPADHDGEFTVGWCSQKTTGGFGEGPKTSEGRKRYDIKGYELMLEPLMKRLEGKVKFKVCSNDYTNAIPHKEMPKWYADIDVLLCTSLYEGGPFSVLEAASCALPVISTNVGIVPELIKHKYNGYLVGKVLSRDAIPDALDKMEEYILRLKDNPAHAGTLGYRSRFEIKEKWSWEKIVPMWKAFFE